MFRDRKEAGERLADALEQYRAQPGLLVLAIPRGGIEPGLIVAQRLQAGFSLIISRKLPLPYNPEAGFGAIAEDGSYNLLDNTRLPAAEIERIKQEQIAVIRRRIKTLREGRDLPELFGKTVILIDDGLAMGSTMSTAIMLCRKQGAKRIVVAVPVSGSSTAEYIKSLADELIVIEIPPFFQAVAQVYENWHDVSDSDALQLLHEYEQHGP